jgi:hypothetical protein
MNRRAWDDGAFGGAAGSQCCRAVLMKVASKTMKGRAFSRRKTRKPAAGPPRRGCRECKFRAASGACLDPAVKSGRCGDWVWWVRGNKQYRRRYARPKDRCTRLQQRCRKRLAAVSAAYSLWLTTEEQHACDVQGAKVRCRERLGRSGWMTGQQYWVHKALAGKSEARNRQKWRTSKVIQRQRLTSRPVS